MTSKTDETAASVSLPEFRSVCKAVDLEIEREFAGAFAQKRTFVKAASYADALSSEKVAGNSWAIAEYSGYADPGPVQSLLCENRWDASEVWDRIARVAPRAMEREFQGDPLGPGIVVDETAQEKRGMATAGVGYQYAGIAGRTVNCITWVAAALVGPSTRTWLSCSLYIPKKSWFTGRKETGAARRRNAGIPKGTRFASKPEIARNQFRHLRETAVRFNYAAGDEVYGRSRALLRDHEAHNEAYAYFVPRNHVVKNLGKERHKVDELPELADAPFEERSAGHGVNGPRYYEWAMIGVISPRHFILVRRPVPHGGESRPQLAAADITARSGESASTRSGDRVKDEGLTFCLCYVPEGSPIKLTMRNLALMAGRRWGAEEVNATAKGPVGWDENQLRKWGSLQRHTALAGLAMLRANLISERLASYPASRGLDSAQEAEENPGAATQSSPAPGREGQLPEFSGDDLRIPLGDSAVPTHAGQGFPGDVGFIKLSINEIMRLRSIALKYLDDAQTAFHLRWSQWRRKHQATARWHHQIRRMKEAQPSTVNQGTRTLSL